MNRKMKSLIGLLAPLAIGMTLGLAALYVVLMIANPATMNSL